MMGSMIWDVGARFVNYVFREGSYDSLKVVAQAYFFPALFAAQ